MAEQTKPTKAEIIENLQKALEASERESVSLSNRVAELEKEATKLKEVICLLSMSELNKEDTPSNEAQYLMSLCLLSEAYSKGEKN